MENVVVNIYETIEETDANQWDNLIFQSDVGSVFQSTAWLKAIENGFDVEGRHVVVSIDRNPVCVFPNFIRPIRSPKSVRENLPTSLTGILFEIASINVGYGGPIAQGNEAETLRLAIDELTESSGYPILSHYIYPYSIDYIRYTSVLQELHYEPVLTACRFVIPLVGSPENVVSNMHKDRRYDIRSACDSRVEVHEESLSFETLREFYEDYERTMQRVDGDVNPFSFFRALKEYAPEKIKIFAAFKDGDVVGRHLYVLDNQQSTIHHRFSAVLEEHFGHNPSEAIHYHVITWGFDEGYENYDLGPTTYDLRDGLFKYKKKYGGKIQPIITFEQGLSPLWSAYRLGRTMYRRYRDN